MLQSTIALKILSVPTTLATSCADLYASFDTSMLGIFILLDVACFYASSSSLTLRYA